MFRPGRPPSGRQALPRPRLVCNRTLDKRCSIEAFPDSKLQEERAALLCNAFHLPMRKSTTLDI
jgi:hypothetical protein